MAFAFADSVKLIHESSMFRGFRVRVNDKRWMHKSRNDVVLISNESLEIWSSCGSELQYRLMTWETGAMTISIRPFLSLSPARKDRDSLRPTATLVETVIWFRRLIFSIGGALTFQSAVNSAVVRGWSGWDHPSVRSVGISLWVHIVLSRGIVTVKNIWRDKEYIFFMIIYLKSH